MTSFRESLARGDAGETIVSDWFKERGYYVTRTSYARDSEPGGARMRGDGKAIVLPDLQVSGRGATRWVEVKTKSSDVDYKASREWRQGIEWAYFQQYLAAEKESGIEGWLAFLVLKADEGGSVLRIAKLGDMFAHFIPHRGSTAPFGGKPMVWWRVDFFDSYRLEQHALLPIVPKVKHPWPIMPKTTPSHKQGYLPWSDQR